MCSAGGAVGRLRAYGGLLSAAAKTLCFYANLAPDGVRHPTCSILVTMQVKLAKEHRYTSYNTGRRMPYLK